MYCSAIFLVCFSILSSTVLSAHLSINGFKSFSGFALIDCTDLLLQKRTEKAKIPYKCMEKNVKGDLLEVPQEEIIILKNIRCSDPKSCRPNFEARLSESCQPDFMFDPVLEECFPISRKECRAGFEYNIILRICISKSLELYIQNDKPLIPPSSHKCAPGYVYSSEVDRCQFLDRPLLTGRPPIESLIKDMPEVSTRVYQEIVGWKMCSKDEVYVSEIDICVPYVKPPQDKNLLPKATPEQSNLRQKRNALPDAKPQQSNCNHGQVYVSEVDLCVDFPKKKVVESHRNAQFVR